MSIKEFALCWSDTFHYLLITFDSHFYALSEFPTQIHKSQTFDSQLLTNQM